MWTDQRFPTESELDVLIRNEIKTLTESHNVGNKITTRVRLREHRTSREVCIGSVPSILHNRGVSENDSLNDL